MNEAIRTVVFLVCCITPAGIVVLVAANAMRAAGGLFSGSDV